MDPVQEELVNWLSPKKDSGSGTTTTIGKAMSESSQGQVDVDFDASVLSDEGAVEGQTTTVTLPTTVYCQEGDTVIISLFGSGGIKTPTVTGVSGGGDKINERVTAIEQGGGGFNWHQLAQLPSFYESIDMMPAPVDFDASGIWCASASGAFYGCELLQSFKTGSMNLSQCADTMEMFASCIGLVSCEFKPASAASLTRTASMFDSCSSLESVCIAGSGFSSISDTLYMFNYCSSLVAVLWLADPPGRYQAAFQHTPIIGGTGYVYVRDSMVSAFEALFTDVATQILPISQCPQTYLTLYDIDPNDYQ